MMYEYLDCENKHHYIYRYSVNDGHRRTAPLDIQIYEAGVLSDQEMEAVVRVVARWVMQMMEERRKDNSSTPSTTAMGLTEKDHAESRLTL